MTEHTENEITQGESFFQVLGAMLREGGLLLALLLLAVTVFKIHYQFEFQSSNPLARFALADENLYIQTATDIAKGKGGPDHVFHMAPLYPYLVAPIFALGGYSPMAVRLFQALLGTASVLLLYLTARFFFSRQWALTAALAMALYYPLTFFEGKVLIATSAVFFSCLLLLLLTVQLRIRNSRIALIAGLAAGLAGALRPNLLLAAPLVALWYLWAVKGKGRILRCLLFVAGTALPILPITAHNLAEGDWVLLSDNGGINFYLGNNPLAKGSYYNPDPIWANIKDQHVMTRRIAEEETGLSLKPSEISRHWMKKGLDFILSEPILYLKLLLQKLKSFHENFEYAIIYAPSVERSLCPSLYFAFIPYAVYLCGAYLGLAALWRNRRREKEKAMIPSRLKAWAPVLIMIGTNLLSILLFFNYSRFRLPAIPAFILLGMLGCGELLRAMRDKRTGAWVAGVIIMAVVLPVSLIHWGNQWKQQAAHGLATVGTAFVQQGDPASAERSFTDAIATKPDMITILAQRGANRMAMGNLSGARDDLEKSVSLSPGYSPNRVALAEFYARPTPFQDLDRAARLMEEAEKTPTGNPTDRINALYVKGSIHMAREEFSSAAAAYSTLSELAPGQAGPLFLAGMAFSKTGENQKARICFKRVLKIDPNHKRAKARLSR